MTEDRALRSRIMRAVKGRDTAPERQVRRLAHRLGYRFRLNRTDLPGSPDLVFPRYRKAIFVHGCFWHAHDCARGSRIPKTNVMYWKRKIEQNSARDAHATRILKVQGWQVLTIWECELKDEARVSERMLGFLELKRHKRPRTQL